MLEIKIKAAGRRYVAPADLRSSLGAERARERLADAIEALLVQMDMIDGDPDLEHDTSDFELTGDESGDPAYSEWHTLTPAQKTGHLLASQNEDVEDCDPVEANGDERDTGNAEDEVLADGALHYRSSGPGCEVSDPAELTSIEGIYHGGACPPWHHDDDEPRNTPTNWAAYRDCGFYRPPANLN